MRLTVPIHLKKSSCRYYLLFFWLLFLFSCSEEKPLDTQSGWQNVPDILAHIAIPVFPAENFSIMDYGAVGDGKYDCTPAFRTAIEACHKAGGGRVLVPEGDFLTGPIHLKSNVNLHIGSQARILFSTQKDEYLPMVYTRFEGVECMNYSPFIYAYGQENIAITGKGVLDGQAGSENWWAWKGQGEYGWLAGMPNGNNDTEELYSMGEADTPVETRIFGDGHHLRPNFIQLYKCKNILIDSITIKRSPMWCMHPVLCENVTVRHVNIDSHGPNNDGCNPESSKNVLIQGCSFNTGDDCIAIKSGRNGDGRRVNVSSENIVIRDCFMKDGHGGVVIGSEVSGNVRNVFVENCTMDSPNLERAFRIKTNSMRGGIVEDFYIRNCVIGEVSEAVVKINFHYGEGDCGKFTPIVRNIDIQNVRSRKSMYAIFVDAYARSPVENLHIRNCEFQSVAKQNILNHYEKVTFSHVTVNGAPL